MTEVRRIAFPFIGGVHHVFHTMPVACALARHPGVAVSVLVADTATEATAAKVAADLGASLRIEQLARSFLADRLLGPHRSKLPILWRNRRLLASFDAIVVPERTSLALQRMGVGSPAFINLPHGAGDRAISVEPRYKRFDRIMVAGPKTAQRMADTGIDPAKIREVGYPKAEYLAGVHRGGARLFHNDRPTVFYNPHFRRTLSSLDQAQAIARSIIEQTDFNLILAPHIRSFEGASEQELARWHALAVPDRVIVDTGSPRLIDMSYVAAADLYLGDVSSQVYEFLLLAIRPCLFVNAHDVSWQHDLSYRHWHLGDVVKPDDVVAGLNAAFLNSDRYAAAQREAVAATFARLEGSSDCAAQVVLECVAARR